MKGNVFARCSRYLVYREEYRMQVMVDKYKAAYGVVEKFCFDREDPVKAINNMRFFPEGYDAFGIEDEELKILRDRILEDFGFEMADLADFGKVLLRTGKYEFGTLAIMLLKKHRPRMDAYVMSAVKEWLDRGVENWAHADLIAIKLIPVFFELELCTLESLALWRESESKWTRRAAITCLNALKSPLSSEEILSFVRPLLSDKEKVVQQALGLCLADLWQKHNEPVESFLAENKESMDQLALKNATAHMPISVAKHFRKPNPHPRNPHAKHKPKFSKKGPKK